MNTLQAIDASIQKWKDVCNRVHKYKSTTTCPLCWQVNGKCEDCIMTAFTYEEECRETAYFETSVHILGGYSVPAIRAGWGITKLERSADTAMLCDLYDLRRWYVFGGNKKFNTVWIGWDA